VTGPPRSGTTIVARIIAHDLKYKFIDETFYDGNNTRKFFTLLNVDKKMVIQCTSFLRDIHELPKIKELPSLVIILVRRDINDILDSMKNSKRFIPTGKNLGFGMVESFNEEEQQKMIKWYGYEGKGLSAPEVVYDHFYKNNTNFYIVKYESFSNHELWKDKKHRRKNFTHMKQISDDPGYISERAGTILCQIKQ